MRTLKPVNVVTSFEIPVHDLDRAIRFYEAVFETDLERQDIDGNQMALFPWDPDAPGVSGALAQGESYVPGPSGTRLYFGTRDLAATLARALAAGGTENYPVTDVPDFGLVAEIIDSEGNIIGLHQAHA